jgi:hypothetical protein
MLSFGDQPEDQISNLLRNSSPPCRLLNLGDPVPVESEACPMPTNHGLWCDHDQSLFPGGPESMGNNPEQFVEPLEPWPRMPAFQNGEQLPKREILQHKFSTAAKKTNEDPKREQKHVVHEAGL